jgi:nitrogenase molybdenum-iron protein alpha/beta subunit
MTPKEYRRKLESIALRYKEIEAIFNTIPEGLRNEILEFHNADGSLLHSIRWGQQACDELIEAYEETHAKASENYDI